MMVMIMIMMMMMTTTTTTTMMMIYLFTAIQSRAGGSSTVHIYKKWYIEQHNRHKQYIEKHLTNWEFLKIMARIHFVYLLGS
jgi:hypothetical protein